MLLVFFLLCGCKPGRALQPNNTPAPAAPATEEIAAPAPANLPDLSACEITFAGDDGEQLTISAEQCGLYSDGYNLLLYEEQFNALCAHLAGEFNREAVDAAANADAVSYAEPFTATPAQSGRELDSTALRDALLRLDFSAQQTRIELPFAELQPAVSDDALTRDRTLLAEFSTSFDSSGLSKKGRVHNITKAAELLNGTVLQPEETGSLNEILGDRNKKNGWKMANAISGGTYVEEYGGGVCQVSSTLFNVWMLADLEVVKRYHHSWPMSYVDAGRDATITTDKKDLVFKNNSSAPLYIFATVDAEAKTISVKVYGQKTGDWASIEIETETIKELPADDTIIKLDESLPHNTKEEFKRKRNGRITRTWRVYRDAAGNEIDRVMLYEDTYSPVQGVTYVSADIYY